MPLPGHSSLQFTTLLQRHTRGKVKSVDSGQTLLSSNLGPGICHLVTLGRFVQLAVPQFPHLYTRVSKMPSEVAARVK